MTRIHRCAIGYGIKTQYQEDFKYVALNSITDTYGKDNIILTASGNIWVRTPRNVTLRMIKGNRQGLKELNSILLCSWHVNFSKRIIL